MRIGAYQRFSAIDFPGKMSCIVFTQGCNFRCGFCHNPELVLPHLFSHSIDEDEFFNFLKSRSEKLDGVVITGGEPTLHPDLPLFIQKIKDMGFAVKLDTNGTNPEMVKKLINMDLLDYIAMDIKGKWEKYEEIVGVKVDLEKIKKSIEIIKKSSIEHEFRTTLLRNYHEVRDFEEIGKVVEGAKKYALQQFVPTKCVKEEMLIQGKPMSIEEMEQIKEILEKYVEKVEIRK